MGTPLDSAGSGLSNAEGASALVTGGAGFIGSHLVDALLAAGRSVVVVDDLSSGHRENLPSGHAGLRFIEGDVRDQALLDAIAQSHDVDVVFHLAAIASVARSVEDPLATLSVNTAGSLRMALWAARSLPRLRRFVFASSAAVYGSLEEVPVGESFALAPSSPYGVEKATVERYLEWLHGGEGLPAVSARFFNVFGPRQDPSSPYSGVLSILARALREDRGFVVHGDGLQTRDFVYVDDVVRALLLVAEAPEAVGRSLNVGTGSETPLLEIVRTIESVAGKRLAVEHGPRRDGDIRRSVADASALGRLGWSPSWSLEDGLRELLGAAGAGSRSSRFGGA